MNRVKNFIGAVKRAVPAFFTAYCYFSMYVPVYAAKATGTSVITSGFNSLYEIVAAIVSSIGQLLLLWGVFEWATALNSQDRIWISCLPCPADRYCYQCIFKIRTGGMIYAGMAV